MKKPILITGIALVFVVFLVAFLPINATRQNSKTVSGVVTGIYEAGTKDAVFVLKGDKTSYYINRGLENGLDLADLQTKLIGKKADVFYAKHWSSSKHITELKAAGALIYSELD